MKEEIEENLIPIGLSLMVIILMGWSVRGWLYYPNEFFTEFKEDKYICDEPCPLNLTRCEFQDGTKSWGYCIKWSKKMR